MTVPSLIFPTVLSAPTPWWSRWVAQALEAEAARERRLEEAQARRAAHRPCPDPACPVCVPFGRHLALDVQQRRRAVWAAQDRDRDRHLARERRDAGAEASGWLRDLGTLREQAGLTQAALAGKVGISARTIRRIEGGRVVWDPPERPRLLVPRELRPRVEADRRFRCLLCEAAVRVALADLPPC